MNEYEKVLAEIRERVRGYWTGAPVPDDEPAKYAMVRLTVEHAKRVGITEYELDRWAITQQGTPTVGAVSTRALQELRARWNRPMGVMRFKARLARVK